MWVLFSASRNVRAYTPLPSPRGSEAEENPLLTLMPVIEYFLSDVGLDLLPTFLLIIHVFHKHPRQFLHLAYQFQSISFILHLELPTSRITEIKSNC